MKEGPNVWALLAALGFAILASSWFMHDPLCQVHASDEGHGETMS